VAQEGSGPAQAVPEDKVGLLILGFGPSESGMRTSSRPIGRLLVNNTAEQEE
jgi:hypothetical protein